MLTEEGPLLYVMYGRGREGELFWVVLHIFSDGGLAFKPKRDDLVDDITVHK